MVVLQGVGPVPTLTATGSVVQQLAVGCKTLSLVLQVEEGLMLA